MGFQIHTTGTDATNALQKLAVLLDREVALQPVHALDRDCILAAAKAYADTLRVDDEHVIVISARSAIVENSDLHLVLRCYVQEDETLKKD